MTNHYRLLPLLASLACVPACGSSSPTSPGDVRTASDRFGTPYLVKDLSPGLQPPYRTSSTLVDAGGSLRFLLDEPSAGLQLWRSDGTSGGTEPIVSFGQAPPGAYGGFFLVSVGSLTYFVGHDAEHGEELWRSDGTAAGTRMVADVTPGPASSPLIQFSRFGRQVTFIRGTRHDRQIRWELMASDGTAPGTRLVKDLGLRWSSGSTRSTISTGVEIRGRLIFTLDDALWRSDGTTEGTEPFATRLSVYYDSVDFLGTDDALFFLTGDSGVPNALWKSDGTASGTVMVRELGESRPDALHRAGATLYFTVGSAIWKSDGTPEGTTPVATSTGSILGATDRLLFFYSQRELWRTDGTPEGTVRIATGLSPRRGMAVGERLFFVGDDGVHGDELWTSDGTAQGTTLVADLRPGPDDADPSNFAVAGTRLFFWANDGRTGRELWALPIRGAR